LQVSATVLIGTNMKDETNSRMFDIIFTKLLEDRLLRAPVQKEYKDISVLITLCLADSDDVVTLSYHLDLLLDIFRMGNENLRSVCSDDKAVLDPSRLELLEQSLLPWKLSDRRWVNVN